MSLQRGRGESDQIWLILTDSFKKSGHSRFSTMNKNQQQPVNGFQQRILPTSSTSGNLVKDTDWSYCKPPQRPPSTLRLAEAEESAKEEDSSSTNLVSINLNQAWETLLHGRTGY